MSCRVSDKFDRSVLKWFEYVKRMKKEQMTKSLYESNMKCSSKETSSFSQGGWKDSRRGAVRGY